MNTELTDSSARIAEMVAHLAGCDIGTARRSIDGAPTSADVLAVVAAAVTDLSASAPTERPPRVTGYLRMDRVPVERAPVEPTTETLGPSGVIDLRDDPDPASIGGDLRVTGYVREVDPAPRLVEHRSLRRWDRPDAGTT